MRANLRVLKILSILNFKAFSQKFENLYLQFRIKKKRKKAFKVERVGNLKQSKSKSV